MDELYDIVHKYNNTYHSATKMKPADVQSRTYINSIKKLMMKILNLKLVILLEYQNVMCFVFSIFDLSMNLAKSNFDVSTLLQFQNSFQFNSPFFSKLLSFQFFIFIFALHLLQVTEIANVIFKRYDILGFLNFPHLQQITKNIFFTFLIFENILVLLYYSSHS